MTSPERFVRWRRQTGLFALLAAPVFWAGQLLVGLSNQASFFSMEEYLQQPMWTADVPYVVNGPLLVSTIAFGVATLVLVITAFAGGSLLFSSFRPTLLFKFCLGVFVAITANLVVYESLATLGYFLARHRLPSQFGGSVQVWAITVAFLAGVSFLFWLCGRRLYRSLEDAEPNFTFGPQRQI